MLLDIKDFMALTRGLLNNGILSKVLTGSLSFVKKKVSQYT